MQKQIKIDEKIQSYCDKHSMLGSIAPYASQIFDKSDVPYESAFGKKIEDNADAMRGASVYKALQIVLGKDFHESTYQDSLTEFFNSSIHVISGKSLDVIDPFMDIKEGKNGLLEITYKNLDD